MPFLSNPFRARGVAFSCPRRHNAASAARVIPSSRGEGLYFHVGSMRTFKVFVLLGWIEKKRRKKVREKKKGRKKLGEMVQMVDCNLVSR